VQRYGGRGRSQSSSERGRGIHRRHAQRSASRHQEEVPVRVGKGHTQREVHTASPTASGRIQHGNKSPGKFGAKRYALMEQNAVDS